MWAAGNKDDDGVVGDGGLAAATDADAAMDSPMYTSRYLRGSYVRFGRALTPSDGDLGDQHLDKSPSSDQRQKRSKHYAFCGDLGVKKYMYWRNPSLRYNVTRIGEVLVQSGGSILEDD